MPDFAIERSCAGRVCGVDEAGRGPLAGPVVAAAVVIDRRRFRGEVRRVLDDSKALSRELREECYRALCAGVRSGSVSIGVGAASAREIDGINILRASLLAMRRAVAALAMSPGPPGLAPDIALVDGNVAPALPCAVRTIVRGDALSFSIAAASVVAKVTRDRIMRALAQRYPGYGWETNVGYATAAHCDGIRRLGVTPHHRRSFEPVRLVAAGQLALPLIAALEAGAP
ncbi:MAG TPA: ribonuclease HII [Stellaceae bacterium]|nr:ribonuclease HII [Stellaceae bacterium]